LHPGGFTRGDKAGIGPFVPAILERGYVAVSANYRLAGEARFPAQIEDAKAVVRWTRANAARYQIDSNRIAAWGISAGSTLAALLGTSEGVKNLEDLSMGNACESGRVNAVVAWYGPTDFVSLGFQRNQPAQATSGNGEPSGTTLMLGGDLAACPEKYRAISALSYISPKCPPFYIQHGTADQVVPLLQSVNFAAALEAAVGKDKVKLNLVENAGHFDRAHSSPQNVKAVLDFLDEHLKPYS
jgi:acetyl esterase/lipase